MASSRRPSIPPWDLAAERPDVAIVVAIKEEFEVLQKEVGKLWYDQESTTHHGFDYFWIDAASQRRCVASFAGDMGPEAAMRLTSQLLVWKPRLVVNIGIAGAVHDDIRIGDVVVPKFVQAYDQGGKMTDGASTWTWGRRGQGHTPSERLVTIADHASIRFDAQFRDWQKRGSQDFKTIRKKSAAAMVIPAGEKDVWRDRPVVHAKTLHLASGHFVVASKLFAGWLREGNEEIKAVEMEAAGMLKEASRPDGPDTLVIRGISDHIDFPKAKSEAIAKGALRKRAMNNALRFFHLLLEHGDLFPSAPESEAPKQGSKKTAKQAAGCAAESPAGDSAGSRSGDEERARSDLAKRLAQLLDTSPRARERLAAVEPAWPAAPSLADAILAESDVCMLAERFAAAMRTEASSERPDRKAGEVLRSAFEFVLPEGMRVHARLNPTDEGIREAQTGQLHVPTADARIASIVGRPMAIRRSKRSNALDSPFCVDLEHLPNTEIHRAEHAVTVGDELLKRLSKVQPSELAELVDRFIDAGVIHRAPAGDLQGQLRFIAIRLAAAAKANGAIYYGIITERCSRPLINLLLTEMPLLWLLQTMRDGGYELDALLESSIEDFYDDFDRIRP